MSLDQAPSAPRPSAHTGRSARGAPGTRGAHGARARGARVHGDPGAGQAAGTLGGQGVSVPTY